MAPALRPRRTTPWAALRAGLCCLLALWLLAAPRAGAAALQERQVKAAFVLKFLGYVEFATPPAPGAPLVVGVAGAPRLGAEMARLAAHAGRPVEVRQLDPGDPLDGVRVLFIGGDEAEHAAPLLRAAARAGILSVTEFDGALREGSVINFRLVDEHVRFEVSLAAAARANLRLSSRLLSVAWLVEKQD